MKSISETGDRTKLLGCLCFHPQNVRVYLSLKPVGLSENNGYGQLRKERLTDGGLLVHGFAGAPDNSVVTVKPR